MLKTVETLRAVRFRPKPAERAYSASPDPYLMERGRANPPQEPTPVLDLTASIFVSSGLSLLDFRPPIENPGDASILPVDSLSMVEII